MYTIRGKQPSPQAKRKAFIRDRSNTLSREPSSEPLIRLRNVKKVYQTAAGDLTALDGVTADVDSGEFLGIIGKSGAGKSTLVNVITGVDRLTSGEIWVNGVPVHQLANAQRPREDQVAHWRGRTVGVIYQSFELLPSLSLLDNVMLPMDFCGLYHPRTSPQRALDLLTQVGLRDHVDKPPSKISGGQQQRVAIARALANDPPLIVADEPTGNLDSSTANEIFALFEGLVAQGKTILMVTHDQGLAKRMSRVLWLADGQIVGQTLNTT
jgi:putative ABC transport system ATP-binding protein